MIGKALIKAHLQTLFVITVFSKHHIENIVNSIENFFPMLSGVLSNSLEQQKKKLFHQYNTQADIASKPLISRIWEIFITAMIVYFLYSIINSIVNERLQNKFEEEEFYEYINTEESISNQRINTTENTKNTKKSKKQKMKFN